MQFTAIQYLRWVRQLALDDPELIPLNFSGMFAPEPDFLGPIDPAKLLEFDHRDHPALAEEIAATWSLKPGQVLVQPGTHWSLFALLAARLRGRPGPVVVEHPCYEPLLRIAQMLGATVLRLERDGSRGFALRQETLDQLTQRFPSVLLLSHPHNPSGAPLSRGEVERLAAWAEQCDCAVISDEVYLEFLEEPERQTLLGKVPGAAVLRSFTKVMGLGSLRCTTVAGPEEWIAEVARFTDYGPLAVAGPSQWLATKAWHRREALWERGRATAREGRRRVKDWLKRMDGLVEATLPEAGIICFPRVGEELSGRLIRRAQDAGVTGPFGYGLDAVGDGSHVWIDHLRRTAKVLLAPGGFFEDPSAFRLGFGIPEDRLEEGLGRIERFFKSALEEA